MKLFSKKLKFSKNLPLGGYKGIRLSKNHSDELEVNTIILDDNIRNINYQISSIDALYPGGLSKINLPKNKYRILCASHTHYAPMIDDKKPKLGQMSFESLEVYKKALDLIDAKEIEIDGFSIYKSEVKVPIYRRFDFPDNLFNQILSYSGTMYPNDKLDIDRGLYIFVFFKGGIPKFSIVYHACHPVSRTNSLKISSDYVGSIRKAIRKRFNIETCVFFLGCAGDIRPNISKKRISWLPKNKLNWRFDYSSKPHVELEIDNLYQESVYDAKIIYTEKLPDINLFKFEKNYLKTIKQGNFDIPILKIGNMLSFEFLPFEVSHLFHLEIIKKNSFRFIVSCCNNTVGYLPHPKQIKSGGYEVDGSRRLMNLNDRVELLDGKLW